MHWNAWCIDSYQDKFIKAQKEHSRINKYVEFKFDISNINFFKYYNSHGNVFYIRKYVSCMNWHSFYIFCFTGMISYLKW